MEHLYLGTTETDQVVSLSPEQRLRHIGVFGSTGVGKSTLLINIIAQDIARGDGLLLLDPHGDLAERVLSLVPPSRSNHVCYFDLSDRAYAVGFNVLDQAGAQERSLIADGVVSAMRAIWIESWGPRLEQILRHAAAALIETPNASLLLLPRLLTDEGFRERVVSRVSDPLTRQFFAQQFNGWRESFRDEAIAPVLNKIDAFLFSPAIRHVVGQSTSTLHLEKAMANGRIVIANLARGLIGESASHLMGALLLARAQSAAMARAALPQASRRPFHLIVDEAQAFGTETIAQLLSEARKYGVSLTLATQFLAGLSERTRAAVIGNVASLVVFRVGHEDALVLAPEFDRAHQTFSPYALRSLERGEAMVRMLDRESTRVMLPGEPPSLGDGERIKKQSQLHYGVSRREIEARFTRLL